MDLLDESKENIQPLKRGRNVSTLSAAIQAQTDVDVYHQLMKEREQFEILVRSYSGDDPLKPWYDYVQWVEQNFPKHGKEGNLKLLLENCLAQFKDSEQYSQDVRYIDLWTRYMSFVDNPLEMYKQIHAHGIGAYCAIFYQCWAEEFELANDMKRADQVFIEGIKRNAQPVEELKAAHTEFQVRVARNVLGQNPLTNQELRYDERTALSTLRAHGKKRNVVDSLRIGNSIKSFTPGVLRPHSGIVSGEKRNSNSQLKIAMFNDENSAFPDAIASAQVKPPVNIKKENINKENILLPGRWNEGKFPKKSSSTNGGFSNTPTPLRTPSFSVHADENITTPQRHCDDIVVSNVLKVRKQVYEDEKSIPIAIFEPADPSKKAMYPKDKVYCGGCEFSLEELRAIIYEKRYEKKKTEPVKNTFYITPIHFQGEEHSIEKKIANSGPTSTSLHSECKFDNNSFNGDDVDNCVPRITEELNVFVDNQEVLQQRENTNLKDIVHDMNSSVEEELNNIPVAIFEPPDPSKEPMYKKNQVYCNGTEYSLEELRANIYQKRFPFYCKKNDSSLAAERLSDGSIENIPLGFGPDLHPTSEQKVMSSNIENNCNVETSNTENNSNGCIRKASFEVYVEDEEEINPKLKKHEPLEMARNKMVPKARKVTHAPPKLSKELPFEGYFKAMKVIKERKGSDELFVGYPCTPENKEFDQSLTVNTKAVMNDVRDMWVSSPPRSNNLEVSSQGFSGVNLRQNNTNSCVKKGITPLEIFHDSVFGEQKSEQSICPENGKNTPCSRRNRVETSNEEVEKNEMLFACPQNVKTVEKRPLSEETKTSGNVFNIYADSFLEEPGNAVAHCGIPFVPSPGMTASQKAAMVGTEDKENLHLESSKKKLCFSDKKSSKGILQPSQDIFYVPSKEQLKELEMEQDTALSDETCSTEAFAVLKPLVSSTPMTIYREKRTGLDEKQMEDSDDNTIFLMNLGKEKFKAESNIPIIDNEQPNRIHNSGDIEAAVVSTNCSTGATQLSTIYETSEYKKSHSQGESSKSSGIDAAQKHWSNRKLASTSFSEMSGLEGGLEDLDLQFKSLCRVIPKDISSSDKPIEFYSNNFRNSSLENMDFPAERHRSHCRKENGVWSHHFTKGDYIIVGDSEFMFSQMLSDKNLMEAQDSSGCVHIRTENVSHLWEHYIKEEIRLRLKDPSMVRHFIAEKMTDIYCNVIVTVSPCAKSEMNLQDFLAKKCTMSTSLNEAAVFPFACKMIDIVFHLHQCNIVHGNISITSFLIKDMDPLEDYFLFLTHYGNAVDTTLLPESSIFDVTVKDIFKKMNAWNISPYRIDYIGLADVLHHLIFNKSLCVYKEHGQWHLSSSLPSYFQHELWDMLFKDLLNSSDVDLLTYFHKFNECIVDRNMTGWEIARTFL